LIYLVYIKTLTVGYIENFGKKVLMKIETSKFYARLGNALVCAFLLSIIFINIFFIKIVDFFPGLFRSTYIGLAIYLIIILIILIGFTYFLYTKTNSIKRMRGRTGIGLAIELLSFFIYEVVTAPGGFGDWSVPVAFLLGLIPGILFLVMGTILLNSANKEDGLPWYKF